MNKVGRNDPCPCGSGKKYKKCCLAQDEKRHLENTQEDKMEVLFEDLPLIYDAYAEEEAEDLEDGSEADWEPYVSKIISKDRPEISAQDQALVDKWWSEYKELDDEADQLIRHFHAFFQEHPDLVDNLHLDEALLELSATLVKQGQFTDYIEFLKHARQTFPTAYLKGFAYSDRDIIAHTIAEHGCSAEIPTYLEWFKEYPDHDPDTLFEVINLLMVNACDEPLRDLLEATYDPLIRSTRVINGGDAMDILVYAYCADCIDSRCAESGLDSLIERLEALGHRLRDQWYDPKRLSDILEQIGGELDSGFLDSFKTAKDLAQYYDTATLNFMGWLHREKGFSWMKAQFYRQQMLRYLLYSTPKGKRPRQPFTFTKHLVDRTLARNAQQLFMLDPTRALGSVNAMYWFAEYLAQRAFISAELGADLQRWCEEMWTSLSVGMRNEGLEQNTFKQFPS